MNGHDPHDIFALAQCTRGREIGTAPLQGIHIAQKTKQTSFIRTLKIARTIDEHAQIRLPQDAVGKCADIVIVPRCTV